MSRSRSGLAAVQRGAAAVIVCGWLGGLPAAADQFTYRDERGREITLEARLAGSGMNVHALEAADGRIVLVPASAVLQRSVGPDPLPLDETAMEALLREEFGADLLRVRRQKPYVIAVQLAAPLPEAHERRAAAFLERAGRFLRNVEKEFLAFAREARFPLQPPRFPMVVLIFESDADFDAHARPLIGRAGPQPNQIAGFYSALTNRLVLRLRECHTFETPLHEAIHQQLFNRGVLERLAPIPAWFIEGIATGFEGDGERIDVGPAKISRRYARLARAARPMDWEHVISDDAPFHGDVLSGDGYAHAWSLHWLLVTQYKVPYMQYVRLLSQKPALSADSPVQRLQEFRQVLGKEPHLLAREFREVLAAGLKKQKIDLDSDPAADSRWKTDGLAEYRVSGVFRPDLDGALLVDGTLKSLHPFRPLAFHVTVETDAGMYAQWHVPELGVGQEAVLDQQQASKRMRGAPGGPGAFYVVRVHWAPPNSAQARRWQAGDFPVPVFRPGVAP